MFTTAQRDDAGRLMLSGREPFQFQVFADTRSHTVAAGESLFSLAARYFPSFRRPAGLWWVIADFQPTPIFDPTIELVPGEVLLIPSERVLLEHVFAADRRVSA